MTKKNIGATLVVVGFVTWFGGSLFPPLVPFNTIGIPLIVVGAVLYFVGQKKRG